MIGKDIYSGYDQSNKYFSSKISQITARVSVKDKLASQAPGNKK